MTDVEIPSDADLLVSGCTFHWLDDLSGFLSMLRTSVAPKTPLVFSIMLKGTVAEVQDARRQALPQHEPPEELPDFENIMEHCTRAGWRIDHQEELPFCTRFTSAWELLQSLQRTGVTGGKYGTKDHPLYRRDLKRLMDELTHIYGQHRDGIPLHYQVGFVHCRAE